MLVPGVTSFFSSMKANSRTRVNASIKCYNYLVFTFLDELQKTHGLRTDDFIKYRQFCSRKLMRLRSKFHLHHSAQSTVQVTIDQCKANSE